MPKVLSLLTCLLMCFSNNAIAQNQETVLDPVTITAGLIPKSASVTGRNILIVKGSTISQMPVNSIDELIRYLPGLEVQSRGPMGVQSNITIRGGTFQQVLIILDGIRLNDPLTGHFNSYIPITPAEIDRIEILKGASAAIYGSEAVGGVVHIITKTFTSKTNQPYQAISANIVTGNFGLRNAQAGFNYHKNKTAFSAGIINNVAEGQPLRGTAGFFNLSTISFSVRHYFNQNWSVAYRGAYDNRNFSAQNFYTQFLSDTATERVKTDWQHLNISYQKNKHSFRIDGGLKNASDKYQFRNAAVANTNHSKIIQMQAVHTYEFNNNLVLTSGLQYVARSVRSNNRGNHSINSTAAFVLLNYKIGEYFNIHPGLRMDWNERYGVEVIPQLNVSYRKKQFQLRANAGKGLRDADFTERFNNYQPALVGAGNRIGNPDLYTERSFNYEFGADYFVTPDFKLSASYFGRNQKGLIDFVFTNYVNIPRKDNLVAGANYNLAKNIDAVNTRGFETDIQFSKKISEKEQLILTSGLIWMKSLSSDTLPSLYVSNHARFLMNFSVLYRYKNVSISLNGLYKERREQIGNAAFVPLSKNYFLMNGKLQLHGMNDKLRVFVQADNLFNKKYSDILGTVMPERWLMGGIAFNL